MVSEHASPLAVIGGVDAGGQNVHVAALASAMADRGHEVVVYTRRDSPQLAQRVELRAGLTVEHLDAGPPAPIPKDDLLAYVPDLAADLRPRLATFSPAVVHAHFWMSGLASLEAVRGLDVPVVQTFHALGTVKRRMQGSCDTSPAARVEHERSIAREAHRVIASCTEEVRELVALGASFARIDVVPSGVDCDRFAPVGPVARRTSTRRLLAIGRLVPRKGVDDVITALQWLPDTELIVAGGPSTADVGADPEAVRLMQLAEKCGVAHHVQLVGQVPHTELPALIRSADLVTCLPWYEPFGIVPLEAMSCGVPVVGTAVGGLLDTVIDGVTGVLLPPRQPAVAAAAIQDLLADEQRRRAMGAAGRDRVGHYTWARVARSAERTYLRSMLARAAVRTDGQPAPREAVG
ncbi:MAG: glycosyltransferase family 1 protein [Pseudonocardiales bacterium]|nr:glycosyltransferase family 1 protein [Pseudonocardiales bacterium]